MHKLEEFFNDHFVEFICIMAVGWLFLVGYGIAMQ